MLIISIASSAIRARSHDNNDGQIMGFKARSDDIFLGTRLYRFTEAIRDNRQYKVGLDGEGEVCLFDYYRATLSALSFLFRFSTIMHRRLFRFARRVAVCVWTAIENHQCVVPRHTTTQLTRSSRRKRPSIIYL